MQAIIMAGGEGSRLRPLTCDRPKPMVPLVNKPVMEHTVDLLCKLGWNDIGVTLQYLPQEITEYFGDGSAFNVKMQYFIEDVPLGTAGSVKNASAFIKDTFLVLSGDALTNFDLESALEFHKKNGAWVTLVLKKVNIPLEYGVVITAENGGIRRFLEKPGWGEVFSDTVNTGIYIIEPQVLDYIPDKTKFDFSQDLFPLLMREGKPLFGYLADGYWCDIGGLAQYLQANMDVLSGTATVTEIRETLQGGKIWLGKNVAISKGANIYGPIIIGDNTVIEQGAEIGPYSVIGPNCRIGANSSIKKSVLWDGVVLEPMAEVRGAVLCSQVKMQSRSAVFEGAVLGDRVTVETMAKVRPGVKVWPDKVIEKETIQKDNLVWSKTGTKNIFGLEGISGAPNTEILPEYAARIGAAFGAVMGAGEKIILSSDEIPASLMVKLALASGLLSVGCQVVDIGQVPVPLHRFAVKSLGAKGGLHVMLAEENNNLVIRMTDARGIPISRNIERKIENHLQREDFGRAPANRIGSITDYAGIYDKYLDNILSFINVERIARRKPKVFVYNRGLNKNLLVSLMEKLGCQMVIAPAENGVTFSEQELLARLRQMIIHEQADLGVVLGSSGERLELIDDLGRVFGKDDYLTLTTAMLLKRSQGRDKKQALKVAVPVTMPGLVEMVARETEAQVIRTKSLPQQYFEELLKDEIMQTQEIPQYLLAFDGIAGLVGILDFLAAGDTKLSSFIDELPKVYNRKKSVNCSWENKGKVMRSLIEEHGGEDCVGQNRGKKVQVIDGIKIFDRDGWALILPDVEKPLYHVYTEGANFEIAESLADFYVDKIKQLVNEKQPGD
ncbi:nucleotidyltransferase [Thermincola ferriacetica]|uniref:Nucleotidyltransferase n=1 Tax=Thermincola ferriacetica TaxID=281456 RepID=A0A0L6VZ86_9FIRM|nr:sugar phosphate nucleotidyltransferase [Thermincola ferriacetica]KNZ68521.1 nucleotidyltransferase [Thermincola ferriacetica]